MKKINIDFTDSTVGNLGRAGEHNNTEIIFALSPELAKCDFLTAEIGTAAGDKVPVEGTYNEENNTFSILLTNQLTAEGKISLQLVGYVTDSETAEPQSIAKSPIVSGFITEGINGVETAAESNPNLLARIWAKIREWADKIHTHENYWTLTDFYCEASELEADNEFPTLPDYVGVDRPTFRGNHLRYSSDGGVIRKVEEKGDGDDKFLRLWFDKGVVDTLFDVPDFIDIPVKLVSEKVEEIVGPGLISNSLGLELDLGLNSAGGTGGGLTPEQAAQLAANTAARHEHDNKDVLDSIGLDENTGRVLVNDDGLLTESDLGSIISRDEFSDFSNSIDEGFANFQEQLDITNAELYNTTEYSLYRILNLSGREHHILPNTFYDFGKAETLTITFVPTEFLEHFLNEYTFTFISGETPTVLTLPDTVKWANELTIEANKRYEISIIDNIGLWCAVEVSV